MQINTNLMYKAKLHSQNKVNSIRFIKNENLIDIYLKLCQVSNITASDIKKKLFKKNR